MSAEEMRDYCNSLSSFKIRVQVRLKNGQEVMIGRIGKVDSDRFQLVSDSDVVHDLNYSWVARIKNA
ncbi:MAG: hypothetical protein RL011_2406 [Pseudomonadota bacterium]|jgi:small nuclear ribonucleoprotein (snRNP)-like protein